jgi:hypothetical protein
LIVQAPFSHTLTLQTAPAAGFGHVLALVQTQVKLTHVGSLAGQTPQTRVHPSLPHSAP